MKKYIENYLSYCEYQRLLSTKTLKAYKIDLFQFVKAVNSRGQLEGLDPVNKECLNYYIKKINKLSPRTIRRKLASLKAFFRYLEREDLIPFNPFNKISLRIPIPRDLPKTIDINSLNSIFSTIYGCSLISNNSFKEKTSNRDVLIFELLLNTGIRVSELCNIRYDNFKNNYQSLQVLGKGKRQRNIPIANNFLKEAIGKHMCKSNSKEGYLFLNRLGLKLSEQSVRNLVKKYCIASGLTQNITPHVFRHSFATLLLEQEIDIRYIQQLLGHSSITTTEIYTRVTESKKREILLNKSPRNLIVLTE